MQVAVGEATRMTGDGVRDVPISAPRPRIALLGAAGTLELAAHLRSAGANFLDAETVPDAASDDLAARYGYRRLSARTGDVGSLSALTSILQSVTTGQLPSRWIWRGADGRLRDGFRVSVEPDGIADTAELTFLRETHLRALLSVLRDADELILLLTGDGCLVDAQDGTPYPFHPVVDARLHKGIRLDHEREDMERLDKDFMALHGLLAELNPRLLLRVALVPLPVGPKGMAADFAAQLPALRHQSDLRVLMTHWAATLPGVRYLPIWEQCTGPLVQAGQFSSTTGQLTPEGGVALAHLCLGPSVREPMAATGGKPDVVDAAEDPAQKKARRAERRAKRAGKGAASEAVICEEELLEAFSR
jgi:hypothetical protein